MRSYDPRLRGDDREVRGDDREVRGDDEGHRVVIPETSGIHYLAHGRALNVWIPVPAFAGKTAGMTEPLPE